MVLLWFEPPETDFFSCSTTSPSSLNSAENHPVNLSRVVCVVVVFIELALLEVVAAVVF